MMEKAVIDRFEENQAVLLVGDDQRHVVVSRECLPEGAREGQWLALEIDGARLVSAVIDEEETRRAKQRIAEKLERLRKGKHRERQT